jgi:hypothetical protein
MYKEIGAGFYACLMNRIRGNISFEERLISSVTNLEWPRGFQEVKVPRFHDNGTGWW